MPWVLEKDGKTFIVKNKETGRIAGHHKTREKAVAQMRLLYMLKNKHVLKGDGIHKNDEIYLETSIESYLPPNQRQNIDTYIYDRELSNDNIAVYYSPTKNDLIIAHRGTHDKHDVLEDAKIISGNFEKSERLKKTFKQVENILKYYPTATVTNTGHSLASRISQYIGLMLPLNKSKVVGFNSGTAPIDIRKNLINIVKCYLFNTDECKKYKNQTLYTTLIDPISILSVITPSKVKIVKPTKLNPHSLSNF